MDIQTLTIVTSVTAATMAVALGAMARFSPSDPCLRDWSAAGALFLINSLVGIVAVADPLPPWSVAAANLCTIAGYLLVWSGLRRFLGHSPAHRWVIGIAAVSLALLALPAMRSSLPLRLLVGWPVIAGTCFAMAWLMLRVPRPQRTPALTGLAAWMAVYGSQQALRVALLAHAMAVGQPIDWNSVLMTAGRLLFFLFILVTMPWCALLVIQDKAAALRRHADLDSLTGWFNRRSMAGMLAAEVARARRQGSGLHLLVFDIDHFKTINDQHGHGVGDSALRHVTQRVAEALREYDLRFRIGGEEFVVCVPGAQATAAAERLRVHVATSPLDVAGQPLTITVSVGCAALGPGDAGWEGLLQRADEALYRAKREGRNRVSAAPLSEPVAA